jgi:hypothetical protein
MAPTAILITMPLGLLLYLLFIKPSITKKQRAPLPPGPPPKLLIGNLRDLPSTDRKNWVHFLQHRDLYGKDDPLDLAYKNTFYSWICRPDQFLDCLRPDDRHSQRCARRIRPAREAVEYLLFPAKDGLRRRNVSLCPLSNLRTMANRHRVGWEHILAMQPYSDMFRAYRKAMHRVLGTKNVIAQFNELQDVETRRFLLRVLEKPGDLVQHIRT